MKLSLATTFLITLMAVSIPGTPGEAQTLGDRDTMLPGPLATWTSNSAESQMAQTLIEPTTDKKLVLVEVTRIEVDLDCDAPIKSFFKPGSFEVHSGSMPTVNPKAPLGESRISTAESANASTTEFATACDSVRTSMPVMLGKLDDAGASALKQSLAQQHFLQLPTASAWSGFATSVHDVAERPFVVGVKPIKKGKTVVHQPIIQTIEDGYVVRIEPTLKDGSINLDTSIAYSTVSNVETFRVSGSEKEGITIQIPEQKLKQVRLSQELQDGETLFVDPRLRVETVQRKEKLPFAKTKVVTVEKQVYFLVTPRIIEPSEEQLTGLTQVKQ